MIERWDGRFEEAILHLERACRLAAATGDRRREHGCRVALVQVELERGRISDAQVRAQDLAPLAARLGAAEAAQAEALLALARAATPDSDRWRAFHGSLEPLRMLDSKADLAYVLAGGAWQALEQGDVAQAADLAAEALAVAGPMELSSEEAIALAALRRSGRIDPASPAVLSSAEALSFCARRALNTAGLAPTLAHTPPRDPGA